MNEFEVQVRSFDILSMHMMVYRLDTILPTYHVLKYVLTYRNKWYFRSALQKVIYSQMMWMCTRHGN